jgi:hypothetical protein
MHLGNIILVKVGLILEFLWNLFQLIYILFSTMKIILNSIIFVPLVWKLWNKKHAQHPIRNFPKLEWKAKLFERGGGLHHGHIQIKKIEKKKNTPIFIYKFACKIKHEFIAS